MLNLFRLVGFILLLNWLPLAPATTNCAEVTQIPVVECEALIDLYNSTNGPHWKKAWGWNENNTPCDWGEKTPYGIGRYGVTCESGHVIYLSLPQNGLNGGILPESLGNLVNLEYLAFSANSLKGSIPKTLGNLTKLRSLYLEGNNFSGSLPESLGNLANLRVFYLHFSQVSGSIPETFGNLVNLRILSLAENKLIGSIPDTLGNLINLEYLILSNNQLVGVIPATLGDLVSLRGLDLDGNQLNGTIPSTLGNLVNLTRIELYDNKLIGPIPDALGNLVKLEGIRLHDNQLSGTIPKFIGNLNELADLTLNNNELCGDIPPSLMNLSFPPYGEISLDHNHLTTSDLDLINWLNGLNPSWMSTQTPPYDCPSLSVKLIYFSVTTTLGGTYFEWETGTENDSVGFHLWQAQPLEVNCSQFTNEIQLTDKMIPSQGDENSGAYYKYPYEGLVNTPSSCYGLEERKTSGKRNFYVIGPGIEKWKTFSIE